MATVTVINRTQAEIVLSTDTVKNGKLVKTPVKYTRTRRDGTVEEGEGSLIVLDGMPRGALKTNPVVFDIKDWERISKNEAVAGLVEQQMIEVR